MTVPRSPLRYDRSCVSGRQQGSRRRLSIFGPTGQFPYGSRQCHWQRLDDKQCHELTDDNVVVGSGTAQTLQFTPSVTSLSFGNVLVGSTSGSQTVSVSKTGNGSVTISQLTTAGTGFTAAGMAVCQAPVRTSWKRMTVIKHVYLGSNCRSIRAVRHLAPARMLSVTMWFTTSAQTELKFRRFPLVAIVL